MNEGQPFCHFNATQSEHFVLHLAVCIQHIRLKGKTTILKRLRGQIFHKKKTKYFENKKSLHQRKNIAKLNL